jgi:hypothetical protein
MIHLKLLEKQEQAKPKISRREITKIRAEINEIETKIIIINNNNNNNNTKNEMKSWFFEKLSKLDKTMANMTKMGMERTKLVKSEMKKGR